MQAATSCRESTENDPFFENTGMPARFSTIFCAQPKEMAKVASFARRKSCK
jgi:hypothetical protein